MNIAKFLRTTFLQNISGGSFCHCFECTAYNFFLLKEYFLKYVPVFLEMKEMGRAGGVDGVINIIQIQIH